MVNEGVTSLLTEKEIANAIALIREIYEKVIQPEYGSKEVSVDLLSDSSLQKTILGHMETALDLQEAVAKTTRGLREALAETCKVHPGPIIDERARELMAIILKKSNVETSAK